MGGGNSISIFLDVTVGRRKLQTRVNTSLIAVASARQNQGSTVQRWKSRPGKKKGRGEGVMYSSSTSVSTLGKGLRRSLSERMIHEAD